LDEVETLSILGPGGVPLVRFDRDYTWYVRDGFHVRSPLKFEGVPIPEDERRKYEQHWLESEQARRKHRQERDARREKEGKGPALSAPAINEPRFVSESYFMDFKFEPGNYYLAGREKLDGQDVLKIDYYPARLFSDEDRGESADRKDQKDQKDQKRPPSAKEQRQEQDIERKMNKTAQVTIWVDPAINQIVKYTFDNVWLDFLPAGWLVRIDDLRASMEMQQPFPKAPNVWLPRGIKIHAGFTLANGSFEASYTRTFSNYRLADVTTKITIPKKDAR
jgi:hypothetical protein